MSTVTDGRLADSPLRRTVDVTVALLALVLLSPVLLLLGVLVRLSSPGPAVFKQERVGRDGRPFTIWKFRTMVVTPTGFGPQVSGVTDPRITGLGRWLREHRLDELPQLVNLVRGDLTLIGPRPEIPEFVDHYTPEERLLLRVRPGVLGPGALLFAASQAAELDAVPDPHAHYVQHQLHQKLALDLEYLRDRTVRRDLGLIARTLGVVA